MSKILTILAALAELLARYFRLKEQQDHEQQQEQIKKDPAVWFDDHFNGDDNGVHTNEPMPDNADDAKQASTNEHSKNE
jgi:hypothetical protein